MPRIVILSLVITSLFTITASPARADESPDFSPEIRLLLHGTSLASNVPGHEDTSVGLAVWVIEPNLLDANPQAQATAGLQLASNTSWIELLGGGVFSPTTETVASPVFDLRAFAAPAKHLHLFGEVSVYGDALYFFAQADVPIRKSDGDVAAKIGVEVEGAKAWKGTGGFLAVGPHMILPWSEHFATIVAFQTRGTYAPTGPVTDLVGRIYAVIDF